jgi:hypothetical protein
MLQPQPPIRFPAIDIQRPRPEFNDVPTDAADSIDLQHPSSLRHHRPVGDHSKSFGQAEPRYEKQHAFQLQYSEKVGLAARKPDTKKKAASECGQDQGVQLLGFITP